MTEPLQNTTPAPLPIETPIDERPLVVDWANMWKLALATLVFLAAFFYFLSPVLTPFLLGALLAYFAHPAVDTLCRWRLPRSLAAVTLIALGITCIVGFILVVIPLVQQEINQISRRLPQLAETITRDYLPQIEQRFGVKLSVEQLKDMASTSSEQTSNIVKKILSTVQSGGLSVLSFLANALLTPVVVFYLLKDWPNLTGKLNELLPRSLKPQADSLLGEINTVMAEFLRGQGSVMLLLSCYYCLGLWIAGLEFWLPVGLITGLLVIIPYLGFGLGFILGMVAALTPESGQVEMTRVWMILGVYGIGQLLEGFLLTPWLVGERVGLHPLAVLFSLLAFGQLFGFFGVLLAVPASAVLLVALRHVKQTYQASHLYQ
jgi:predicted PurR-regulated permease PerM